MGKKLKSFTGTGMRKVWEKVWEEVATIKQRLMRNGCLSAGNCANTLLSALGRFSQGPQRLCGPIPVNLKLLNEMNEKMRARRNLPSYPQRKRSAMRNSKL